MASVAGFGPPAALVLSAPFAETTRGMRSVMAQSAIWFGIIAAVMILLVVVGRWLEVRSSRAMAGVAASFALAQLVAIALVLPPWLLVKPPTAGTIGHPLTVVPDQTAFGKTFFELHASGYPSNLRGARRSHVLFDEYSVMRPDETEFSARHFLGWEEFGYPIRWLRVPIEWESPRLAIRHRPASVLGSIELLPVRFVLNLAIWFVPVLALARGPAFARWMRRASSGSCIGCGHSMLMSQDMCPECGRRVRPMDRLFVRSGRGE